MGPDLTGGERRRDLDSLLSKIVDPSAELPADSRLALVKLKDGRTVSGIIDNRTATTLTLRTTADPITVALADIQSTELSSDVDHAGRTLRRLQPQISAGISSRT